ncbi:2Fe-2S iron-sulfur cluster-binding protein [Nocardia flavorosea]|uniref:2Fe-2S iron-sulfur cluster-binding protein n=1 Tax=Nocardia flavorosea TaxID=53429 RepID=UPI00245465B7|nr:2Fe-2S iron-sulfur cluster-binding protein [Nocardia flavorosea]
MRMTVAGHTLRQADAGYSLLQASRPFLEWRVRGRVRALPGVELVDHTAVSGLLFDTGRARVTGVRTADGREFDADLVVGCLGRHGPVDEWLTGLGYERPAEHGVRIDMKYASRYVRLPPRSVGGDKEIVIANQNPARGLALFAVEDGAHILTLIGYGSDHPPTDPDGFWRFAASVAPRDVREALVGAEVLSDIATYRYPANRRRRYERLTRFPDGLLVLGDAVCSFSPAFGQGMTVSALQARQLGEVLAIGDHDLRRRYFRAVARTIDDAWRITELFDLAMPHVDAAGRKPLRALGALAGVAMAIGERDAAIGTRIARIAGLLDGPETLLRPAPAGRAALAAGTLAAAAVLRLPRDRNTRPAPLFDPLPHGPARGFHRLVVRSVVRDTGDSAIVEFDIPAHLRSRFTYTAGQHLVIRGTRCGEPVRRSYSLCDAPGAGRVRIAVKRQPGGAFSSYVLDERITGPALYVSEPSGVFTPELDPTACHEYTAVAAGSGITPIVAIIAAVLEAEPDSVFTLHYGSRHRAGIMLARSVRELCDRYPGRLRAVHYLSRQHPRNAQDSGVQYRSGRMAAADIARQHADRWFLCGPKTLVTETVDALHARGVPGSRIQVELFDTRTPHRPPAVAGSATSRVTLAGYGEPLEFDMPRDRTILDAALDEREDLPYSCLGGSCGTCLAVVADGHAEMEPDPLLAITGDEITRGRVLACRARPVTEQVTLRFGSGPAEKSRTPESVPGRAPVSPGGAGH